MSDLELNVAKKSKVSVTTLAFFDFLRSESIRIRLRDRISS